jgi:hypothetical protein
MDLNSAVAQRQKNNWVQFQEFQKVPVEVIFCGFCAAQYVQMSL